MAGLCGEIIFSLTELIFARIFPVLQDGRAKDHSVSLFRDAPVREYTEEPDSVAQVLLLSGSTCASSSYRIVV